MNYNLKVELERVNGQIVAQLEVSGIGRSSRKVIRAATFDEALVELKKEHDVQLAALETFHNHKPAPAAAAPADDGLTEAEKEQNAKAAALVKKAQDKAAKAKALADAKEAADKATKPAKVKKVAPKKTKPKGK